MVCYIINLHTNIGQKNRRIKKKGFVMSLFGTILQKLGLSKPKPAETTPAPATSKPAAPAPAAPASKPAMAAPKPAAPAAPVTTAAQPSAPKAEEESHQALSKAAAPAPAPTPMSEVDVVKHLEQLSVGKGLDWKVSIVDLLKLLDMDSSREARNELAKELGCPPELMSDSAKMNVWLHKTVLKKIAENGGNIPKELLD